MHMSDLVKTSKNVIFMINYSPKGLIRFHNEGAVCTEEYPSRIGPKIDAIVNELNMLIAINNKTLKKEGYN